MEIWQWAVAVKVKAVIAVVNQIVVKSQALGESDRCVRRSTVERRAFVVFLGRCTVEVVIRTVSNFS